MGLRICIRIVRGIPDSLSCISHSKAQDPDSTSKIFPDFGFHKHQISQMPEYGLPYKGRRTQTSEKNGLTDTFSVRPNRSTDDFSMGLKFLEILVEWQLHPLRGGEKLWERGWNYLWRASNSWWGPLRSHKQTKHWIILERRLLTVFMKSTEHHFPLSPSTVLSFIRS